MTTLNGNLEDQILSTLNESPTGELTSQDILEKIKDANLRQVEGTLTKKLIPGKFCVIRKKDQGRVYVITNKGKRRLEQSPRVTQQTSGRRPETDPTMETQPTSPPPQMPFLQTQLPVQFYPYPNPSPMNFAPAMSQGYYVYTQQPPLSNLQGKRSGLRVKLAKGLDAKAQVTVADDENKRKQSSLKVEGSGIAWDLLLTETRRIRAQGEAINEVMSRPLASGRFTTPQTSSRTFLDKRPRRDPALTDQTSRPLKSLASMGPPPGELCLPLNSHGQDMNKDENKMEIEIEDGSD